MLRRRVKPTTTFEQRLIDQAKLLRQKAKLLPHGALREETLRRARQAETATQINRWLTGPATRPRQR